MASQDRHSAAVCRARRAEGNRGMDDREDLLSPALALGPHQAESVSDTEPLTADDLARGVCRLFRHMGFAPIIEYPLGNGRRADVAGLNAKGMMVIAEVKSGLADFRADGKWPDYLAFCDCFYFAVGADFPLDVFAGVQPEMQRSGIIVADRFGGTIVREAGEIKMNAGRRRAETLRFARRAAARLHRVMDPAF